ncbi:MAG: hypothetical protein JWR84_1049 [Caulobacter sp.]|nr:hypothetical protein [Caulobacter sp.]
MRGLIAAAGLGLAVLLGAGTAGAAPAPLTAEGKCEMVIAAVVGVSDRCNRMTLREDPASGEMILIFDFPSGLVIELQGGDIQVGEWRMMSPGRMRWTNAGGKPQAYSNPAGEPNPQLTGNCAVALQAARTQLFETYCRLHTPLGDLTINFKTPRTDKS